MSQSIHSSIGAGEKERVVGTSADLAVLGTSMYAISEEEEDGVFRLSGRSRRYGVGQWPSPAAVVGFVRFASSSSTVDTSHDRPPPAGVAGVEFIAWFAAAALQAGLCRGSREL